MNSLIKKTVHTSKYVIGVLLLSCTFIQQAFSYDIHSAAQKGELEFIKKYIANDGDIDEEKVLDSSPDKHNKYHSQYFSDKPRYIIYFNYAWKNLGEGYNFSMAVINESSLAEEVFALAESPLVSAIMHKQESAALLLISASENIGVVDNQGRLALHYASYYGMTNTIKPLIDKNIKINDETNINVHEEDSKLDRSPLLMSIYGGSNRNMETIRLLINLGANIKDMDTLGRTPLLLAARDNNVELVKYLSGKGADINTTDYDGNFPLVFAVLHNNLPMIKFLVSKGADTQQLYKDSNLLAIAALGPDYKKNTLMPGTPPTKKGSLKVIEFLLNNNVDPNAGDIPSLHMAILSNNIMNFNYLLSKGASASKPVDSGNERSPMHQAAFKNRIALAKILISKKAMLSTHDDDDYTPADYALRYGFNDLLTLLTRHGGKLKPAPVDYYADDDE